MSNQVQLAEITHKEEALLKKRKRDDLDQRKRIDARAKAKLALGRQKKMEEKEKKGANILMPEVFISNVMKQRRNFAHYKRNKNQIQRTEEAAQKFGLKDQINHLATEKTDINLKQDSLVLAIRIKGKNESTTPQVQKILSDMGLREINNAVFLKANSETIKQLILVQEYISYGYPTKKTVNQLVRKRGFIRKDGKKEPISNNLLIEELLGKPEEDDDHQGCLCLEDVLETINRSWKQENDKMFKRIVKLLWPFQLASRKDTMEEGNIVHQNTQREVRKKNSKVKKGGYQGFMAEQINSYIEKLI